MYFFEEIEDGYPLSFRSDAVESAMVISKGEIIIFIKIVNNLYI